MDCAEWIPVTVRIGEDLQMVQVKPGENLLMALVRHNLPVDFFCTTGKCTTCRNRVDATPGAVAPPDETERYRLGEALLGAGFRLLCRLYVHGPLTVYL